MKVWKVCSATGIKSGIDLATAFALIRGKVGIIASMWEITKGIRISSQCEGKLPICPTEVIWKRSRKESKSNRSDF